jgi:hypothetical protein
MMNALDLVPYKMDRVHKIKPGRARQADYIPFRQGLSKNFQEISRGKTRVLGWRLVMMVSGKIHAGRLMLIRD